MAARQAGGHNQPTCWAVAVASGTPWQTMLCRLQHAHTWLRSGVHNATGSGGRLAHAAARSLGGDTHGARRRFRHLPHRTLASLGGITALCRGAPARQAKRQHIQGPSATHRSPDTHLCRLPGLLHRALGSFLCLGARRHRIVAIPADVRQLALRQRGGGSGRRGVAGAGAVLSAWRQADGGCGAGAGAPGSSCRPHPRPAAWRLHKCAGGGRINSRWPPPGIDGHRHSNHLAATEAGSGTACTPWLRPAHTCCGGVGKLVGRAPGGSKASAGAGPCHSGGGRRRCPPAAAGCCQPTAHQPGGQHVSLKDAKWVHRSGLRPRLVPRQLPGGAGLSSPSAWAFAPACRSPNLPRPVQPHHDAQAGVQGPAARQPAHPAAAPPPANRRCLRPAQPSRRRRTRLQAGSTARRQHEGPDRESAAQRAAQDLAAAARDSVSGSALAHSCRQKAVGQQPCVAVTPL